MTYDLATLNAELIRDEGLRLKPYRDTAGKLTIGVGRNLEDRGITEREAHEMLANDILDIAYDLDRLIPWWRGLSDARQRALLNVGFNVGVGGLLKFHKMLAALQAGDFTTAAHEARDSLWARQVGQRAERVAQLISEG